MLEEKYFHIEITSQLHHSYAASLLVDMLAYELANDYSQNACKFRRPGPTDVSCSISSY